MKDITIHPQATIMQAMEALGKTAEKVLIVVDDDGSLIGSLTDGDIRRLILKGGDLKGSIEEAYNPVPVFIYQKDASPERIKQLLTENKVELVPTLNENRKVVDYTTWEKAFGNSRAPVKHKLDAPVVIMAGGRGARLKPFTEVLPKPLIPVGDKPVIDHIIDRFRAVGVRDFFITLHHMSRILRAYFEEKMPDYSIEFAEEKEPRGTAGSLKLLAEKLDKPFFVSNCDTIIDADYVDLHRFHTKNNYDITLVASTKEFSIPYGVCELNTGGNLERIQEKPEYNFLANTGLYILNATVVDLIPNDQLFHITHLINKIKENSGTVGVYPVSEKSWVDVGQWAEYRKALKQFEGV